MESHRGSGLPQRDHKQHSPRGSLQSDSAGQFGVRVQVQEIKGHPYVVVNNGGKDPCCYGSQECLRDVSVIGLQSENRLAMVRGSPLGSPSWDRRPALNQGQYGSQGEFRESSRSPTGFHYQRYPELLRPYDPDNSLRVPSPTHMGHSNMIPKFRDGQAVLPKARIPLPAEGSVEADSQPQSQNQSQSQPQSQAFTPSRAPRDQAEATRMSPSSVEPEPVPSVGRLIDQFDKPQRRGRCGRRGRIHPEDQRRSHSVDSSQPFSPSSLSSVRGETPGGSSVPGSPRAVPGSPRAVPGSPRARFFVGEVPPLAHRRGDSKSTTMLYRGQEEKEQPSPRAVKVLYRGDKTSTSTSTTDETTEDRDTQVTPDLLKGWQELLPEPNAETTKHILYTYLKDGTTDNDSTTQKKVNLVFDRIGQLKWKTAEKVEAENKDFAAEAKALQEKGDALERQVSDLKKQLEDETLNEKSLADACMKARKNVKGLQEELETRHQELSKLRGRLAEMETELQTTKQELVQLKAEREKSRMEMKDLQQQLSEMHDELDQAKTSEADRIQDEVLLKDMAQLRVEFQEVLQVQEEQEEMLRWRERELTALKGALKEEVETHDKDMVSLREEYEKEFQELRLLVEKVKESNGLLGREKARVAEESGAAQEQVMELTQEREQLRGQVQDLEREVDHLKHMIQESRALENQLEERSNQLRKEKQHVEETLTQVKEKEEELCQANHALAVRLEYIQSEFTQLNHEHRDMKEKLKEERRQTEELRRRQSGLEEERQLQDTRVEQLQKQMSDLVGECETSTDRLQAQIDEARETSFRELAALQKQLQEKGVELEKSRQSANKLQEELSTLEEDLKRCLRDRDTAQETSRQLGRRVEEVEERGTAAQEEQAKQVKVLEGRISQLEEDLSEESSSTDLLTNRVDKGKEQLEKMRGELLQERAAKQDLECDKITLERQNKDLKGRVSYLEGSQKANQDGLVAKLVARVQELEEKLQLEERDNSNLQQANRKLERKVKEMMMQVEDEHLSVQTQKDQLTQRLKTAKRQMDEAEEEIERLEHAKKKLQRELDEQAESSEELQSQLHALRNEMRRKAKSAPLMMIVEDRVDDCISD